MPIDRVRSCKGLRIAALLAGTSLGAVDAYAVDGTWQGPGSEWTTGSNWSSGTVPDGVARFTTVGPTSISIPLAPVPNINTIFFDAPASAYTITNNSTLNILGTGIVNTSTNTQTITNNFLMTFRNSSTAGSATIINQTPRGRSPAKSGLWTKAPVAKRASSLFQVQVPPSTYRGSARAA
jgi:hypothetical protein